MRAASFGSHTSHTAPTLPLSPSAASSAASDGAGSPQCTWAAHGGGGEGIQGERGRGRGGGRGKGVCPRCTHEQVESVGHVAVQVGLRVSPRLRAVAHRHVQLRTQVRGHEVWREMRRQIERAVCAQVRLEGRRDHLPSGADGRAGVRAGGRPSAASGGVARERAAICACGARRRGTRHALEHSRAILEHSREWLAHRTQRCAMTAHSAHTTHPMRTTLKIGGAGAHAIAIQPPPQRALCRPARPQAAPASAHTARGACLHQIVKIGGG